MVTATAMGRAIFCSLVSHFRPVGFMKNYTKCWWAHVESRVRGTNQVQNPGIYENAVTIAEPDLYYSQFLQGPEGNSLGQKEIGENGCGVSGGKEASLSLESGEPLRAILSDPITMERREGKQPMTERENTAARRAKKKQLYEDTLRKQMFVNYQAGIDPSLDPWLPIRWGRPVYRDGFWYFEVPTDGSPAYMDETTFYRVRNRRYGWPPYFDQHDD